MGRYYWSPWRDYFRFARCSEWGQGVIDWLSMPIGAIGFLAFFTAAIWYCKLEMDEVVMDYFGGSVRSFGLLLNKIIAFVLWAAVAFAVIKLAFLG